MSGLFAILSPAKTLDMSASADTSVSTTKPRMAPRTNALAEALQGYSPTRLGKLMSISEKLSKENAERFAAFGSRSNPKAAAAMCFRGDVYQGLEAWTLKARALTWLQDHVRILSGLYGILRPLDVIQAYRLEMGTKLKTDQGKDLYTFWGDDIAGIIRKDMKAAKASTLVNLASDEYSKAARLDELDAPIVNVKFLQVDKGKTKFISFYGKHARGLMARWMAENRPRTVSDLGKFNAQGYRFAKGDSNDDHLVFTRPKPAPAKAG
ncbi:MAG: peroxide stress protein YaaA [Phycisphaerales bacterium]|nr:peroxide stress protein YaaA [Phycisphaerales bacterium]